MRDIKYPKREEILDELERVCKSESFERSTRLRDFLRFVVLKSIEGEEDKIKGYTIGVEVFGKPEGFDPDSDSAVRVEAARLRKSLKLYYHAEGKDNPLEITIPKGAYKPIIFYKDVSLEKELKKKEESRKTPLIIITLLFLVSLSLVVFIVSGKNQLPYKSYEITRQEIIPDLVILPFHDEGSSETKSITQELSFQLSEKLVGFSEIRVLDIRNYLTAEQWQDGRAEIGENIGADYLIEGTVRQNIDTIQIVIRLMGVKKSTYLWTYKTEVNVAPAEIPKFINTVTEAVAAQLASPYGIIMGLEQKKIGLMKSLSDEWYSCILDYYAYANNKSLQQHKTVKACLEKLVKADPEYSEAWAYLSWMYGDEVRYGYGKNAEKSIRQSLHFAHKAIEISSRSARSHQYMSAAYALAGDHDRAVKHIKLAFSLNPYDTNILADMAWTMGLVGNWELVKEYGEKAIRLNSSYPRWYNGIMALYHYNSGEYEQALMYAQDYYQPEHLLSNLVLCSIHGVLNDIDNAEKIVAVMEQNFPNFFKNPGHKINSYGFQPEFTDKFRIGLELCGLEVTKE